LTYTSRYLYRYISTEEGEGKEGRGEGEKEKGREQEGEEKARGKKKRELPRSKIAKRLGDVIHTPLCHVLVKCPQFFSLLFNIEM
tara:strand:+ start:578 stop:832 length:255 start_codon:yes stop_codon:yes gene_type:complete